MTVRRPSSTTGLSPRVRGNPLPQPCVTPHGGLSPRVRGNQFLRGVSAGRHRSIPACAGEPLARVSHTHSRRVYPRVCGGTGVGHSGVYADRGLSPRVRGNPQCCQKPLALLRSIPACAGEPGTPLPSSHPRTVYPRVCGGTGCRRISGSRRTGLSPRVRGNQLLSTAKLRYARSIPACAGEPR